MSKTIDKSFNSLRKYKMAPYRPKVSLAKTDTIENILKKIGSNRIYNFAKQRSKVSASFPAAQNAVAYEVEMLYKLATLLEKKGY